MERVHPRIASERGFRAHASTEREAGPGLEARMADRFGRFPASMRGHPTNDVGDASRSSP
jgi:hypothetical protein